MAQILLAVSEDEVPRFLKMLLQHQVTATLTLAQAERSILEGRFDLVLSTLMFDDSRMFELLRWSATNASHKVPVICLCLDHGAILNDAIVEGLHIAARALGAEAFIDLTRFKTEDEIQNTLRQFIDETLQNTNRRNSGSIPAGCLMEDESAVKSGPQ